MLQSAFASLYGILLGLFGFTQQTVPDLYNFWFVGASLLATIVVLCLPFYIVYRVVRWLSA